MSNTYTGGHVVWQIASVDGSDGRKVGIEKGEDDERDGHQVHVEAEQDAAVVEAPTWADAAGGVDGAENGCDCGQQQPERGAVVGEVREPEREQDAGEDQQVPAGERALA